MTAFSTAQQATIAADIAANSDMNTQPHNSDGAFAIAALYNAQAAGPYYVWDNAVPILVIMDNITWANYTPVDAPDSTVTWSNRSLAAQGKQFNLQTMFQSRLTFDANRATLRSGLTDATQNLPTGTGGAILSGGWANIKTAITRTATRIEKLLATGSGTQGTPSTLAQVAGASFGGAITYQDIQAIMGW